jgi:hypothetical protein
MVPNGPQLFRKILHIGICAGCCGNKQFAVYAIANGHITSCAAGSSAVMLTPLTYEHHEKALLRAVDAPAGASGCKKV